MAPEVFEPETAGLNSSQPSKASDIYALGMVVLEVISQVVVRYPDDRLYLDFHRKCTIFQTA